MNLDGRSVDFTSDWLSIDKNRYFWESRVSVQVMIKSKMH